MRIIFVLINILIGLSMGVSVTNAQTRKALLIGISDYGCESSNNDSIWTNIHGANDVSLLEPSLTRQGFLTTVLYDHKATAQQIRSSMSQFLNKVNEGDLVCFHFSGHGQPVEDTSGDEDDGWDESIVPVDAEMIYGVNGYDGRNHILDDELNIFFQRLRQKIGPAGLLVVVLDACHMGTAYRGEEDDEVFIRGTRNAFSPNRKLFVPRIDNRSNIKLESSSTISKVYVLEACRSYQVNTEIQENDTFYGPLSYYFNKHLMSNDISQIGHWLSRVIDDMRKDMRLIRQNPIVESSEPLE